MTEDKSKPNPDWISAPYSVSGISDLKALQLAIADALERFREIRVVATKDGADAVLWNISEVKIL